MFQFFTAPTQDAGGLDAVTLTHAGFYAVMTLIAVLVVTALALRPKTERAKGITTKQLVFSAAAMALGTVTSMIKFADLPMGGSITLFSMLFIVLIGHWYGAKIGITTAVAYGLLQFILQPVFYTLPQVIVDYPLAFGALGLSGFFCHRKHGLALGYLAGVFGRLFFHEVSGLIFFTSYVGSLKGNAIAVWGTLLYNASYVLTEAALTLLLLSLPGVRRQFEQIKNSV